MKKSRFIVIALIILTGVLVTVRGGTVSYSLFFMSLLLPSISILYLVFVYYRFRIYQVVVHKVVTKAERVPYQFILANEDFFTYCNVSVSFLGEYAKLEAIEENKNYCLVPGERIVHETVVTCNYRGVYAIGIDKVTICDFLNIWKLTYRCPTKIEMQVLPRVIPLENLSIAPPLEDVKHRMPVLFERAMVPDTEIRNYQSGDSARMIHWKSSARQGELMSKKYTEDPKPGFSIFLNLHFASNSERDMIVYSDCVVECVLSISDYLLRKRMPCSVIYEMNGLQREPIANSGDFDRLFSFCSTVAFRSKLSGDQLVQEGRMFLGTDRHCLLVTAEWNQAICLSCGKLYELGNHVTVLYVGAMMTAEERPPLDEKILFYQLNMDEEVSDILDKEGG